MGTEIAYSTSGGFIYGAGSSVYPYKSGGGGGSGGSGGAAGGGGAATTQPGAPGGGGNGKSSPTTPTCPKCDSSGCDVYVVIWDESLLRHGSVGHVAIVDSSGETLTSPFPLHPLAEGLKGSPNVKKDYGDALNAEARKPDQVYLVHVPDCSALRCAAQEQTQLPTWYSVPDPRLHETNCVWAGSIALRNHLKSLTYVNWR